MICEVCYVPPPPPPPRNWITVFFITVDPPFPPPLIRPSILQRKSDLIRLVTSLEGDNLAVFYYFGAFEICSDKGVAFS